MMRKLAHFSWEMFSLEGLHIPFWGCSEGQRFNLFNLGLQ